MNIISKWLKARKEKQELKQFSRGYDWALKTLQSGQTVDYVENYIGGVFSKDRFDMGAHEAIGDFLDAKREEGYLNLIADLEADAQLEPVADGYVDQDGPDDYLDDVFGKEQHGKAI
jgi:hypothetical protein